MAVAMGAIFVVALTVPEAWHDAPGGLDGPVVMVCAYLAVRVVHLLVYMAAAEGDRALRRQLLVTWIPMLSGAALLLLGSLLGGWRQTVLFAAGLLIDWAGTYVTSRRGGGWRLHSAAHWTERHALFMILAIGESVVAIGVGAASLPVSVSLVVGAALGVGISVCLWWLYFDIVSGAAEHSLLQRHGQARVRLAVEAYTYLHFPLVAGVVITALGVEVALGHSGDDVGLGAFGALALNGGLALYLLGHLAFKGRMHSELSIPRLACAVALVALVPVAAATPPLVSLLLAAVCLGVLVAVETWRYSETRAELRQAR
jgi:low temperature requirement protein LtrA